MSNDGDVGVADEGSRAAGLSGRLRSGYRRQVVSGRRLGELQADMATLSRRVAQLEAELAQERRLQRRVAELTDVVQQLLLPRDGVDDAELRRRLEVYAEEI